MVLPSKEKQKKTLKNVDMSNKILQNIALFS